MATSAGFQSINLLNVNSLYIQGVPFDDNQPSLQAEIDAINAQLVGIEAVTNKIDTTGLTLPPQCIITNATTNQALKTLIDAINVNIGALNKFDVSQMPAAPPATILITPTTTNAALKILIDGNSSNITTLQGDVTTIQGQITTIQGQITSINNSITAINNKLAHFSTFSYGLDTMSGIADGTGFACAVSSGSQSGNGIFVYPNTSVQTEQIQLISANDKNILLRGGDQVGIFGSSTASMTNRTLIDIGDKTDIIHIGRNHNALEFPEIDIGVDLGLGGNASTTNIQGDVYFSAFGGVGAVVTQTPLLYGDATPGLKFGNTNNYTLKPVLAGLDVTAVGVVPITLTAVSGLILISNVLGGIALTCGGGAIAMTTGGGLCSISTGAGAVTLSTGAGVMNFSTGAGNMSMSTLSGDVTIGAGTGLGGSAGNVKINAYDKVMLGDSVETDAVEIYKAAFVELLDNTAPAPIITANRLYQQGDALYWNGQLVQGGSGNQYVLKAGDTMTGTLNLPEAATPIVTLTNLITPPSPVTNRLYLLNGTLTFNGTAVSGAGVFVPLAGGTMTGALNINYSQAAGTTPQLNIINTNGTGNGGQLRLQNQKSGAGALGDSCGVVTFAAKNSSSAPNVTYATIGGFVGDPSAGTHDGRLSTSVAVSGTTTEVMRILSTSSGTTQANIGCANTTIGVGAIGSTSSQALRVIGTTAITTSLDVPLIINAPNIYPATATTLVDNAVRKYQPERLYRLVDYPDPLGPPTIDGEKVIILNNTGAPAGGIDQILQASDFPSVSSATLVQIIQNVYVSSTATTPAASYITAAYSDSTISLFVLPDGGGVTLTLTAIARFVPSSGQAYVNDFVVTTYGATHRIYAGGLFDTIQYLGGGSNPSCNNFSGQFVVTWGGNEPNYTITSAVAFPMLSNHCGYDVAGFGSWTNINGVNAEITCVINVNNIGGFVQPNNTFDSICIGGDFMNIGSVAYRPLARLAYYSFYDADGTAQTLFSQSTNTLSTNWGGTQYQVLGSFSPINSGNYDSFSCECAFQYVVNGPFQPPTATMVIELLNPAGAVISSSAPIGVLGSNTYNLALTPNVSLVGGFYYQIRANCTDFTTTAPFGLLSFGSDSSAPPVPYCIFTANLANGYIGWQTLATDWTNPVGPNTAGSGNKIRGGGLFTTGALGFIFDGTDVSTSVGHLTTNYIFSVIYDNAGLATFYAIGGDADAIDLGQQWGSGHTNSITGGNPVIALNELSYGELYCNRGYSNNQNAPGVYYRPSSVDPYVMTDCLIFAGISLTADQLLPNGSSNAISQVYRNDTLYPNVYWVARATSLETATFSGGVPTYTAVTFTGGGTIPCHSFGGYSNEIGYNGLILVCPTDVYLYKGSIAGELVIDLSGCVVRCANNIYAQNKLTFPVGQDGTSVTLIGDTDVVNPYNKPSWWAISQDGGIYYDNVFVNTSGGVTSILAGTGIAVSSATGAVNISNTGATSIVAGSNITISSTGAGGTGAVTINASAAGGVTSLAPYTLPSGNATPFLTYPALATSGVLQAYVQPTSVSYFNTFNSSITIGNGLSIFGAAIAVPGGTIGNSISPNFLNTSHKYKVTCSVSIQDNIGGGNFCGGNHWGNFSISFANTGIPSTSYGSIWGTQNAQNVGYPITQQSSGNVFGASWTDIFVDAAGSPGIYLSMASTFLISYNGNYSASSLTGYVYWEVEYVPDP